MTSIIVSNTQVEIFKSYAQQQIVEYGFGHRIDDLK